MSLTIENLITKARFDVEWRKGKILRAKIDYDFEPTEYRAGELERHIKALALDQNYLNVLLEKTGEQTKTPDLPIVQWALTEGK